MDKVIPIFQAVCVLIAAAILGNWFFAEQRKLRACGRPWYAVYFTTPGIVIVCIILLLPLLFQLKGI